MRLLKLLILIPVLAMVSSCTTTGSTGNQQLGNSSKAELYQAIYDNVTTTSDARRFFGDPSDIDYYDNTQQEKWTYLYADKSSLWRNYVPVVNFFSRGTKDKQKKIILIFDKNGIMKKALVSESSGESKNGLFD